MKSVNLSLLYRPITSTPFLRSSDYCEIPPCNALKPYICCFWENESSQIPNEKAGRLVIPDTCMDIIIKVNHSDLMVTSSFCTMDEHTYQSHAHATESGAVLSTFGIRFFCWSAMLFSTESFRHTKNNAYFPDVFFRGITDELTEIVYRFHTLFERARAAETVLFRRLNLNRLNCDFMNAISDMIVYRCRMKTSEIALRNALSERKMERIFTESVGVSPKTLSNLIRYQLVWQEVSCCNADILDLVEKYGYTDQAHLLNDFRFRHSMTPAQALLTARVGFLQDKLQDTM